MATKLNAGIFLTLTDHLHFAVKRYYKGITISNRVFWEIRNYYPQEFKVGSFAVDLMNERFRIELPIEEAANIAFHIINAQGEKEETRDGMRYAKMIGSIVNLIRYAYNIETDEEDIHYSRFITHVKYFAERFYSGKMLNDESDQLFEQIANIYPKAMNGSFKVRDYIEQLHGVIIPNEELAYLAVHIHRLTTNMDLDKR